MADRPETQEQSIKARKSQLFEADDRLAPLSASARKPFAVLLRETPAAPLSTGLKALLWGLGVLVAILLILTLTTGGSKRKAAKKDAAPTAKAAARP